MFRKGYLKPLVRGCQNQRLFCISPVTLLPSVYLNYYLDQSPLDDLPFPDLLSAISISCYWIVRLAPALVNLIACDVYRILIHMPLEQTFHLCALL